MVEGNSTPCIKIGLQFKSIANAIAFIVAWPILYSGYFILNLAPNSSWIVIPGLHLLNKVSQGLPVQVSVIPLKWWVSYKIISSDVSSASIFYWIKKGFL